MVRLELLFFFYTGLRETVGDASWTSFFFYTGLLETMGFASCTSFRLRYTLGLPGGMKRVTREGTNQRRRWVHALVRWHLLQGQNRIGQHRNVEDGMRNKHKHYKVYQ